MSIKDLIDTIPEVESDSNAAALSDPKYMDSAATIIRDAMTKGFDVIQLENGDIVTTGTKVIVTQYTWNAKKGTLVIKSQTEKDID